MAGSNPHNALTEEVTPSKVGEHRRNIMSIKINRAIKLGNWHKGPVTTAAVIEQIPEELISSCTGEQLALIANAIDKAYHAGKAATGAEMIDSNCVWVNSINKGIEWEEIDGALVAKFA